MSDLTEIDLKVFGRAASRMAGRVVQVRSRHPVVSAYAGEAYRKGAEGIIDIDPKITTQKDLLYVLCHEAAHLAAHFEEVGTNWNMPESYYTDEGIYKFVRKAHPDVIRMEKEADALSKVWLNYAEKHYKDFGSDDMTRLERQLICLSNYFDPHTLEAIDKSVKSAVAKALNNLAGPRYELIIDDENNTISARQRS